MRVVLTSFLAITSVVLLSGCSIMSPSLEIEAEINVEGAAANSEQKPKAIEPQRSAIQADLLYVLLTSEIAGQRGQLDVALDGYMKAARLTRDVQVAERAAQIAWFTQKKAESIEAINIWLAGEPMSIEANRLKALWLLANARDDEALVQISRLLSLPDVDLKQELVGLVQRMGKMPDKERSLAFMGRVVERYDDSAEAHYAYSLLAFHQGELTKAFTEIEQTRELRADWVEAMVLESQILTKQGKVVEADLVIRQALEIEPGNSKLKMMQAQLMLGSGDIEGAEKAFRQIIKETPENHSALFSLGLLELQRGEQKEAKEKFERLVGVPGWSSQSSFYLGRIALMNKAFKEAVSWFDQVARDRFYLDAQMGAVQALAMVGQVTEARQRLVNLRDQLPEHQVRLYLVEGEILREAGQYQEAFDLYSQAIEIKPDELRLFYARSLVAERIDRLDVLEEDLLQVLAVNPDEVSALNALGYTLANRTERYEEAEKYLQKALELKPGDAAILDSYGWLQFKKGRFEEALVYLQRAYKLNQDAEIAAHLGEVLWAVGKKSQAKKIWQAADKKNPNSEYLRELKERFRGAF